MCIGSFILRFVYWNGGIEWGVVWGGGGWFYFCYVGLYGRCWNVYLLFLDKDVNVYYLGEYDINGKFLWRWYVVFGLSIFVWY